MRARGPSKLVYDSERAASGIGRAMKHSVLNINASQSIIMSLEPSQNVNAHKITINTYP